MRLKISSSLKLALIFLVFGIVYIIFSDRMTFLFAGKDLNLYDSLQHFKGIFFVIFSAGLIYFVSRRLNSSIDKANSEQEEALRRYNVLGMATNDAVWDLNMITGECFTNRTLQEMFGFTADELSDNNTWWTNNLHPDDRERVLSTIESKLRMGGTVWHDEYRFRCKNGSYKNVFDRGFIMRDKAGAPYRIIGAMQDVTEQRLLQQELVNEKLAHRNEMTQRVIIAQEEERRKLGEELHDNINQMLGVVKLYIEQAQADPDAAQEMLEKSAGHLKQTIEELRSLSRSLIPPSLHDLGLLDAIRDLVESIEETKHLKVRINSKELKEKLIPENKKLILYRIVQEQLNNILKHSDADMATILISNPDDSVRLVISDNGKGFDTSKFRAGVGLNNIRSRLEVFNGKMEVNSAPGKGCVLKVDFRLSTAGDER